MFDGNLATLIGGKAGEVHETGHVAADEEVGFLFEDVVEFEGAHFSGDMREGDGEGATEAATLLALSEGEQSDIADGREQGAG